MKEKIKKDKNSPPSSFKVKTAKIGEVMMNWTRKIAENRYFGSIMEGFVMAMPIIIVSSIFMMMAELLPAFGFEYTKSVNGETIITNNTYFQWYRLCMRAYNLSYGCFGIFIVAAISAKLTDKLNGDLSASQKINPTVVAIASMVGYLCISLGQEGYASATSTGFDNITFNALGVKGIFPAILVGLVTPNIYKLCYKYNITIRLPKQVPQAISNSFLSLIPFFFTVLLWSIFGWLFALLTGKSFLIAFFDWIAPAIKGANSTGFLLGYTALYSLVWFIGIHPSVLSAIHEPLKAIGLQENANNLLNGIRPTNMWADSIWTQFTQFGGTGCTLAIPFIIIFFAKSKELKAVGITALIPILFLVNEPVLFGVPLILNPIMLLPFIIIPVITMGIAIFFVQVLGMPASTTAMPWSMPAIISVPTSTNFDWRSFVLVFAAFGISGVGWFPFVLVQDRVKFKGELKTNEALEKPEFIDFRNGITMVKDKLFNKQKHKEIKEKLIAQKAANDVISKKVIVSDTKNNNDISKTDIDKKYEILVICIGAGTSAMLANAINVGAKNNNLTNNYFASATSVGEYSTLINGMDLIILSPQAKPKEKEIIKIVNPLGIKVYATNGSEYIKLTQEPETAFQLIIDLLK